ncbi:polypeptide N-acetylgalactosaminyltransferase 18-like isoform X1 [Lates japonicus]|uniref:Polypeptide N-acetylgalactosaminyltransferase 18-like isoform X1 n=1 Tax=Lates japonicus TaxID=270547 RepID=A0AAD3QWM5_LATJO|nr:polypeptide N-acetylgalactosaminyltransferase 18-like isoform X1 [Lates japonicus]
MTRRKQQNELPEQKARLKLPEFSGPCSEPDLKRRREAESPLKNDLCLDQGPDKSTTPLSCILSRDDTSERVLHQYQQRTSGLSPTVDDDDNKCLWM